MSTELPSSEEFFTVYLTKFGVELHSGCSDRCSNYAMHTSKSYQMAFEFAQTAAFIRKVPLRNRVKGMSSRATLEKQSSP